MATVTGSVKDFRTEPLGSTAEIIFQPEAPATTSAGSVLATKEVRVTPDSSGAFTVTLAASEATNPVTPYWVSIKYLIAGDPFPRTETLRNPIVVPHAGGMISDMFAEVAGARLVTKGDKGDSGNAVQQAAIDALTAKDGRHDSQLTALERSSADHGVTLADHRRLIDGNASVARNYTDARTQGVLDLIDTSNIDLDTDGAPFIHFGSTTVAVLQDTDGNPYYKARS